VELPLGPLMTVEAHLDGERDIGTDLDEGRAEILVLEVEVIVFDKDPLAGIVEVGESGVSPLLSLESVGLFLSHTDKDHPFRLIKLLPILGSDIILAQSWFKMDYRDAVLGGERFNGSNEGLGHTPQECWGRHLVASVVPEEVYQLPWCLQVWNVAVEVDAIQALDFEGYMSAEELVYVGHGHPPFGDYTTLPNHQEQGLFRRPSA